MKRRYWLGGILLAAALAICSVLVWRALPHETPEARVRAAVEARERPSAAPEASPGPEGTQPPYESPVDFDALWNMNPDIYAWLYIPGTQVNYPVLQREGEDGYYLNHNSEGKRDVNGAIFTERTYNGKDFSDPATLIYGHYTDSGIMFGGLQAAYSDLEGLEQFREIIVYLPDQELHYEVFAGVPHGKEHILYYYDFSDPEEYRAFVEEALSVRSIGASVDKDAEPSTDDKLLILSTCLRGDGNRRYLVMAKMGSGNASH